VAEEAGRAVVVEKEVKKEYFAHATAVVDAGAVIGSGCKIWHFSHVMPGATLGDHCSLGQNVYVASSASLGARCRVQNNVSLYDGVSLADDVFIGPSAVFTNVKRPRADHPTPPEAFARTTVEAGATVGANATIVCGVTLGRRCVVGAGSVVTKDVPPYGVVYGNPATLRGWVGEDGEPVEERPSKE